ncbi:DUF1638 domain-containing protein [Aliamphritea ceti]|uniref:DUF1638 domain-containing protein n=1 Tax=Aliamphritea ceti TaxID=1524258 RepID=UPI0021C33D35|nr:DUF1638 domain-containing protein [Aliamphritea ceti]
MRTRRTSRRAARNVERLDDFSGKLEKIIETNAKLPDAPAVVITCSALLKEITMVSKANGWEHLQPQCITAELHNYPEQITGAVKSLIDIAKAKNQQIFVAYGDCGTGGQLDAMLEAEEVERVPGSHCYEFFSGGEIFEQFQENELGTFYLTDFLTRHFDRLIIRGMGLENKPELMPVYFGHYKKLLYIAQTKDSQLEEMAQQAAEKLGLEYEYFYGGTGVLGDALLSFNQRIAVELKD